MFYLNKFLYAHTPANSVNILDRWSVFGSRRAEKETPKAFQHAIGV